MFDLPESKRVRREKLYDSGSESESGGPEDAAAQATLQERLSSLLSFDVAPVVVEEDSSTARAGEAGGEPAAAPADEVFEFKLFSAPKAAGGGGPAPVAKVVLEPADTAADQAGGEGSGDGGFVVPRRPLSHYVAAEPSAERRAQWELSAVTGDEVLARSTQRCWGLEKPWRVTKIVISTGGGKRGGGGSEASTATAASGSPPSAAAADEGKKKRPGKRRRIAMRVKTKALKEEQAKQQTKEEHLREKKKRLNREKQLKRRQKERERKQALQGEAAGGGGSTQAVSENGEVDA
ncbi:hypothetical protein RB595_002875 [Gaeumannomyces hyphopodioides]